MLRKLGAGLFLLNGALLGYLAIAPTPLKTLELAENIATAQVKPLHSQPLDRPLNKQSPQLKDSHSEELLPRLTFAVGNAGVFTIKADGSEHTHLTPEFGHTLVTPLVWSGNGQQLAFADGLGQIYVVNTNGSGLTQVFSTNCFRSPSFNIVWLPDHQHIAFEEICPPPISDAPGSHSLYLSDTRGPEGTRRISTLPMGISRLSFNPKGEQVAFVKDNSIYTMNVDGSGLANLTNNPSDYTFGVSRLVWSPNGAQLAFYLGSYPHQEMYVINADGSNLRSLTSPPNNQQYRDLFWSPDSNYIAYYQGPTNDPWFVQQDIYLITVNTGVVTNLTRMPGKHWGFSWSPDSTAIAFTLIDFSSAEQTLYTVKVEDGTVTQLIPEPVRGVLELAWSPDSQQIAFAADEPRSGTPVSNRVLYVINADGSGLTPLTTDSESVYPFAWQP